MSCILDNHPCFTPWTDPESGVKSYILKQAAPIQQSFYFLSDSLAKDQSRLWFHAAYPPSPWKVLGSVGLTEEDQKIEVYPESGFNCGPLINPDDGNSIYYYLRDGLWLFKIGEPPREIAKMDKDYIAGRQLQLGGHLTFDADRKAISGDGRVGNVNFLARTDLATGKIEIVQEFPRHYNHSQFSTVDSNVIMVAQDWRSEPITGHLTDYEQRIWLTTVDQTEYYPISPKKWHHHNSAIAHEWWTKDGHICWVDYERGVYEYDTKTETTTHLWKTPLCHAHCDDTRQYWCADQSPYHWDETPVGNCHVVFRNRNTGKEVIIASDLPKPKWVRSHYHLDPHPQFSPLNDYIVYTTTVTGDVTVAMTPVKDLIERTL